MSTILRWKMPIIPTHFINLSSIVPCCFYLHSLISSVWNFSCVFFSGEFFMTLSHLSVGMLAYFSYCYRNTLLYSKKVNVYCLIRMFFNFVIGHLFLKFVFVSSLLCYRNCGWGLLSFCLLQYCKMYPIALHTYCLQCNAQRDFPMHPKVYIHLYFLFHWIPRNLTLTVLVSYCLQH